MKRRNFTKGLLGAAAAVFSVPAIAFEKEATFDGDASGIMMETEPGIDEYSDYHFWIESDEFCSGDVLELTDGIVYVSKVATCNRKRYAKIVPLFSGKLSAQERRDIACRHFGYMGQMAPGPRVDYTSDYLSKVTP